MMHKDQWKHIFELALLYLSNHLLPTDQGAFQERLDCNQDIAFSALKYLSFQSYVFEFDVNDDFLSMSKFSSQLAYNR